MTRLEVGPEKNPEPNLQQAKQIHFSFFPIVEHGQRGHTPNEEFPLVSKFSKIPDKFSIYSNSN